MVQIADLESAYWKHLGMRVVIGGDGKAGVELEVTEKLLQRLGNMHGGALASVIDSAIGVAINQQLRPEEDAVTVELKINYLRPVNKGKIRGEGKVIQIGQKIIVAQGEIINESGEIVAIGMATFMRIPHNSDPVTE